MNLNINFLGDLLGSAAAHKINAAIQNEEAKANPVYQMLKPVLQPIANALVTSVTSQLTTQVNAAVTDAASKVTATPGGAEAGAVVSELGGNLASLLSNFQITL